MIELRWRAGGEGVTDHGTTRLTHSQTEVVSRVAKRRSDYGGRWKRDLWTYSGASSPGSAGWSGAPASGDRCPGKSSKQILIYKKKREARTLRRGCVAGPPLV